MRSSHLALVVLILTLPGLFLFGACAAPDSGDQPTAAIVDQLYSLHPNPASVNEMAQLLEGCGFKVDIYQGTQIDVKFYKDLPKYGYKLIIFRAHSGRMARREGEDILVTRTTYLFTDEEYSERKYAKEQLNDQLLMAKITNDYPFVFAVNSKFIMESMNGRFNNTAIVMMGCSTALLEDMAVAFCLKGASIYFGWDNLVGIEHVDEATLYLVQKLLVDKLTVDEAVGDTMAEKGRDPVFNSILKYWHRKNGDHTIQELITG
ncbi:hypothetical protein ACFLV3_07335 [Chloroflexota bacterium]